VARREYGLCLALQGDWSGLPEDQLTQFPASPVGEVKLGRIEDLIYGHQAFPEALKSEIHRWIDGQLVGERQPGQSDEEFYREGRRRALEPFKQQLWELSPEQREQMMADFQSRVGLYLDKLNVEASAGLIRDTVHLKEVKLPAPISGYHQDAETTLHRIIERLVGPPTGPSEFA
jgi:hypothetical protein